MNIENFVNIVYDLKNNSFEGADCIGIVDLFYKCHGWKSCLMDCYPDNITWNLKDFSKLIRNLKDNFKIGTFAEYGDIVVFKRDVTYHMGVVTNDLGLLTQSLPAISFLTVSKVYLFIEWMDWLENGGMIFKRDKKYDKQELKLNEKQMKQISFNHQPKPVRKDVLNKMFRTGACINDIHLVLDELRKTETEKFRCFNQIAEIEQSMIKNNYNAGEGCKC